MKAVFRMKIEISNEEIKKLIFEEIHYEHKTHNKKSDLISIQNSKKNVATIENVDQNIVLFYNLFLHKTFLSLIGPSSFGTFLLVS